MSEFHVKELMFTEALKEYADRTIEEIKAETGDRADVQIHIEPEAKDKGLFWVSMSVFGLKKPIIVKKDGKQIMAVFRKVRKTVLKQIHELSNKKIHKRKRVFLPHAS
ncbi:MAG: hypothetical protein AB7N80_04705 [Bdellovibrionales bacterium]